MCRTKRADVILETMEEGFIELDTDGRVVAFNSAAQRIVGFERDTLMNMDYRMPLDQHVYDEHGNEIGPEQLAAAKALITGEPVLGMVIGLKREVAEKITWVRVNGKPLKNETGEIVGSISVFQDITDEKEREDHLEQRQELFNLITILLEVSKQENRAFLITRYRLTPREVDVLELVGAARTNQEIAEQLDLSYSTVSKCITEIGQKMGARNRVEIARYAWNVGITHLGIT